MEKPVEVNPISSQQKDLAAQWSANLAMATCGRCHWSFLVPAVSLPQRCPHCFQGDLARLEEEAGQVPYLGKPELALPFGVPAGQVAERTQVFARSIPFAPVDLSAANLNSRLRRICIPMWLVDADVQASWQAEAGFDYEVVSHKERYEQNRDSWDTRQVKESRVRWEPRMGRLNRSYQNVAAPAIKENSAFRKALGDYDIRQACGYQAEVIQGAVVRLPNRLPDEAWNEAAPAIQALASEECTRAAGADHIQKFTWQPEYHNLSWTLLLLPLYATYYLDDERKPQPIYIHGQSGQVSGTRRASPKRAQRAAGITLGVAAIIFFASLLITLVGIMVPPLFVIGILGAAAALLAAVGALIPVVVVWQFNRTQTARSAPI